MLFISCFYLLQRLITKTLTSSEIPRVVGEHALGLNGLRLGCVCACVCLCVWSLDTHLLSKLKLKLGFFFSNEMWQSSASLHSLCYCKLPISCHTQILTLALALAQSYDWAGTLLLKRIFVYQAEPVCPSISKYLSASCR